MCKYATLQPSFKTAVILLSYFLKEKKLNSLCAKMVLVSLDDENEIEHGKLPFVRISKS